MPLASSRPVRRSLGESRSVGKHSGLSQHPVKGGFVQHLLGRFGNCFYVLMRVVFGAAFAQYGAQKLFGVLGGMGGSNAPAELFSMMGAAGIIEFVGGILIAVGLFTSYAALLSSGLMGFGYFLEHAPKGFWPLTNGGQLAVLFCFAFLYIASQGGRAFCIDRSRR